MEEIPWKNFASFTEEIALESGSYVFKFDWNTRGLYWVMSIFAKDQSPILLGCKLVIDYELIEAYTARKLPPGAIIPVDLTNKLLRIGRNDMGQNVKLLYITQVEKNAIT